MMSAYGTKRTSAAQNCCCANSALNPFRRAHCSSGRDLVSTPFVCARKGRNLRRICCNAKCAIFGTRQTFQSTQLMSAFADKADSMKAYRERPFSFTHAPSITVVKKAFQAGTNSILHVCYLGRVGALPSITPSVLDAQARRSHLMPVYGVIKVARVE
jgi:hypothetical protein